MSTIKYINSQYYGYKIKKRYLIANYIAMSQIILNAGNSTFDRASGQSLSCAVVLCLRILHVVSLSVGHNTTALARRPEGGLEVTVVLPPEQKSGA